MPTKKPSDPTVELYPFISRVDTAKFLTVSVQQIDKYAQCGTLTPYHVGRKVIFRRDEVLRLVTTGGLPVLPRPRKAAR